MFVLPRRVAWVGETDKGMYQIVNKLNIVFI